MAPSKLIIICQSVTENPTCLAVNGHLDINCHSSNNDSPLSSYQLFCFRTVNMNLITGFITYRYLPTFIQSSDSVGCPLTLCALQIYLLTYLLMMSWNCRPISKAISLHAQLPVTWWSSHAAQFTLLAVALSQCTPPCSVASDCLH